MYCINIYTIEPFSDLQIEQIQNALECHVQYIPRENFNSFNDIDNIEILICRDRDAIVDIVNACSNLKMMFVISAGVEKLPFDLLRERNIIVANAKGVNAKVIATYVMSYITSFAANSFENLENQKKHYWKYYQTVERINEKSLLIVGTGHIGSEIAKYAKAMGLNVIGIRRSPNNSSLPNFDEIDTYHNIEKYIPAADFIVLCCPLTAETRNLFDSQRIGLIKSTCVFMNVARSGLVDMDALYETMCSSKIKAAVIDVFPKEPISENDRWWSTPNVIVTPHSSGRTPNYKEDVLKPLIENIFAYLQGQDIPNRVDLINQY